MTAMTQLVARLLLLPAWMVAFAILVKGYVDTGDGFSAGIIAALGVLLQYLAFGTDVAGWLFPVRYARQIAAIGLLLALSVAFSSVLRGDPIMTHLPAAGGHVSHIGSVELTTAFAFDVGVFLLVLGFSIGAIDLLARASDGRAR